MLVHARGPKREQRGRATMTLAPRDWIGGRGPARAAGCARIHGNLTNKGDTHSIANTSGNKSRDEQEFLLLPFPPRRSTQPRPPRSQTALHLTHSCQRRHQAGRVHGHHHALFAGAQPGQLRGRGQADRPLGQLPLPPDVQELVAQVLAVSKGLPLRGGCWWRWMVVVSSCGVCS